MSVSLKNLHKTFSDGTDAVKNLNLEIDMGEFITFLGPSGCGKTTTLRLIAGLEEPTAGDIFINEKRVNDVDPGDRNIAMVFQSYALYPHMSVLDNMTLNLTVSGLSKAEAVAKARGVAEMLGLQDSLEKKPGKLSGGQRQRVALGRAMVRDPVCYLMDEPLSNLDLKLREQMRTELKRIHRREKVTTVYVTHDQAEALILSDRVTVMDHGEIQQTGDPVEIYEYPVNEFVAEFIGSPSINFLKARIDSNNTVLGGKPLETKSVHATDGPVILGVRPEDIILDKPEAGVIRGNIEFLEPQGGVIHVFIALEDGENILRNKDYLVVNIDTHEKIKIGSAVGIRFRGQRISHFDYETRQAISKS